MKDCRRKHEEDMYVMTEQLDRSGLSTDLTGESYVVQSWTAFESCWQRNAIWKASSHNATTSRIRPLKPLSNAIKLRPPIVYADKTGKIDGRIIDTA